MDASVSESFWNVVSDLRDVFRTAVEHAVRLGREVWTTEPVNTVVAQPASLRTEIELRRVLAASTSHMIQVFILEDLDTSVIPRIRSSEVLYQRLLSDASGHPLSDIERDVFLRNSWLKDIVEIYLGQLDNLAWSDGAFDSVMSEWWTHLSGEGDSMVTKVSLQNFTADVDEFEIGNGYHIERLDWEEARHLYEFAFLYGGGAREAYWWARIKYVLVHEYVRPWETEPFESAQQIERRLDSIVSALRLLNSGNLTVGETWSERIGPRFGIVQEHRSNAETHVVEDRDAMRIAFVPETGRELLETAQLYDARPSDPVFELALSRFLIAYERNFIEDRFLDIWIGLEAIFTGKGETAETTDKLARRIGRLLGERVEERLATQKRARYLYGLRSRVVHGDRVDREELIEADAEHFDILRKMLKLRSGWTIEGLELAMMN
jgi:hypothetical protein